MCGKQKLGSTWKIVLAVCSQNIYYYNKCFQVDSKDWSDKGMSRRIWVFDGFVLLEVQYYFYQVITRSHTKILNFLKQAPINFLIFTTNQKLMTHKDLNDS